MKTNQQDSSVNPHSVDEKTWGVIANDDGQSRIEHLNRTLERAACLADCLGVALDARDKVKLK